MAALFATPVEVPADMRASAHPAPVAGSVSSDRIGGSRGADRTANAGWSRLALASVAVLQPKLRLGAVDDPAEREADRVAEAVVGRADMPLSPTQQAYFESRFGDLQSRQLPARDRMPSVRQATTERIQRQVEEDDEDRLEDASPTRPTMTMDLLGSEARAGRERYRWLSLARQLGSMDGYLNFLIGQVSTGQERFRPPSERLKRSFSDATTAPGTPSIADTTTDFERTLDQAMAEGLVERTTDGTLVVVIARDPGVMALGALDGFSEAYTGAQRMTLEEEGFADVLSAINSIALTLLDLQFIEFIAGALSVGSRAVQGIATRAFALLDEPATRRLMQAYLERGFAGPAVAHRSIMPGFVVRIGGPYGEFAERWFASRSAAEARARLLADLGPAELRRLFALPSGWRDPVTGRLLAASEVTEVTVYEFPAGARYLEGPVGPQCEPLSGAILPGGGDQMSFIGATEGFSEPLRRVLSVPVHAAGL